MTMALDPSTGAQRPDLPTTNGQATFDASANGQYQIQGLLPGIYDLYVYADGYQTILGQHGVTVLTGVSLHFDFYVTPA
jgi:protocatechuate 3,4-dioxygenase beta subunit